MNYLYRLQKYAGHSSRHRCPKCKRDGVFVRYVDTATGEYLSPEVGRCNREVQCGYHYTPKQYFADYPSTERAPFISARQPEVVAPVSVPTGTIDRRYLDRSLGLKSHFAAWLSRYFDTEAVRRVVDDYALGYTKEGRVIFWQQDAGGRIRTGQVMRYNPCTGRRIKNRTGAMDWVHAILKRRGELSEDFNLRQCLFGEHLLATYPEPSPSREQSSLLELPRRERRSANMVSEAIVVLVESAKSVAVCASLLPEFVWCATNGRAGFSPERCRALTGRKVIVIPDLDAHADWSAKAPAIVRDAGCEIAVSDFLVRHCSANHHDSGYDIADYIIDQLDDEVPHECIAEKLREQLETYFIPDRLAKLIAGCLENKEPFKCKLAIPNSGNPKRFR